MNESFLSNEDEEKIILVTDDDRNQFKRLDHFLHAKLPEFSRTFLQNLFLTDDIYSTNTSLKLSLNKMPPANTELVISIPPPIPSTAVAENIPLEILFEDDHLMIVNKPQGMVTHPAPGNYTGTLVNAVLFHAKDLKGVGDQKRPGIVHRLDKGTSGIMAVAKTQKCHEGLVLLFSKHDIERQYEALTLTTKHVLGKLAQSGTIESLIDRSRSNRLLMTTHTTHGKKAITHYKILGQFAHLTHLEFTLHTGRTHQIRVHAKELLNTPLLMDPLYGHPKEQLNRLPDHLKLQLQDVEFPFLHAKVLGFIHPITKSPMRFEIPPPKIFQELLEYERSL